MHLCVAHETEIIASTLLAGTRTRFALAVSLIFVKARVALGANATLLVAIGASG